MRVLRGFAGSWPHQSAPAALAVGVFDGMHSGHRAVLAELRATAARSGLVPGVVTFDPHPLAVVAPDRAPAMLTGIEHRIELLGALGVELVAVVQFDEQTRNWTPEQFAVELLAGTLAAHAVLVGEDFRFGRDRSGDIAALGRIGDAAGFRTVVVSLVGEGQPVSSSRLRGSILRGELAAVTAELGRPHELRGLAHADRGGYVVHIPAGMAVPPPGAYAVTVGRDRDEAHPARATWGEELWLEPLAAALDLADSMVRVRLIAAVPDDAGAARVLQALDPQGA